MLTKILKRIGGLFVLILLAGGIMVLVGNTRLARKYAVQPEAILIPTDPASIEQDRWPRRRLVEGDLHHGGPYQAGCRHAVGGLRPLSDVEL